MPAADLRFLAFFLPQFHPIPENDEWWGPGFTEWTNVVRARPRFPGHYQPHLPADLGFYDLRVPEVRHQQAELARTHGIDGFCYYHYWFNGRRLLERPVDDLLRTGEPDFPFALCWANENWTRVWDGGDQHQLMTQHYSEADDRAHLRELARYMSDPRYIRVDGKPLFLVYRAHHLPDPRRTTDVWREEAARLGLGDLYLCRVEAWWADREDPRPLGFDAGVEFQPDFMRLGPILHRELWRRVPRRLFRPSSGYRPNNVHEYRAMVELSLGRPPVPYKRYRCVTPSWDNAARRKTGALILRDSTPELYERWLRAVIDEFEPYGPEENFVFVNAWNEWAEGNHLEPDERWGRAYLEAHARATGAAR